MLKIDESLITELAAKIGPNALSVLLAVAVHTTHESNRCVVSNDRLMAFAGIGRDALYTALERLKEFGLLTSDQDVDSGNKTFGRRYLTLHTRLITREPLSVSKRHTDHPYTAH